MERVVHTIPVQVWQESDTLILGSIPSPKSRETGFYYGHPQNRFWQVTAAVFGAQTPGSIPEKRDFLRRNRLALWDVLASCEISGASDASIQSPQPNDIAGLLADYPAIRRIFTTGKTAHRLYQRLCRPATGIDAFCLPSTSPANCACSTAALIEAYRILAE